MSEKMPMDIWVHDYAHNATDHHVQGGHMGKGGEARDLTSQNVGSIPTGCSNNKPVLAKAVSPLPSIEVHSGQSTAMSLHGDPYEAAKREIDHA